MGLVVFHPPPAVSARFITCISFVHTGGSIRPALCNQREQQQENLRGALPGLCPQGEPQPGQLCGAGAVQG